MKRLNGRYDTPIGPKDSVTRILDVAFGSSYLGPWYGKLEREALTNLWWEDYKGLTHFESKEHLSQHINEILTKYAGQVKFEEATALGSLVDNMVSAYYEGLFEPKNTDDYLLFLSDYYDTKPIKMLAGFFSAIKANKIKILKTQQTVYCPECAGTLDYEVAFDDAEGIADLKATKDIRIKNWLQLEAYRRAKMWMDKKEPAFRMVIWLDSDQPGKCEIRVRPLEINTEIRLYIDGRRKNKEYVREVRKFDCDHEKDWQAFLSAKTLFERSKQK